MCSQREYTFDVQSSTIVHFNIGLLPNQSRIMNLRIAFNIYNQMNSSVFGALLLGIFVINYK